MYLWFAENVQCQHLLWWSSCCFIGTGIGTKAVFREYLKKSSVLHRDVPNRFFFLRKKAPASKLFLYRFLFFILLKQLLYFDMALSYSAFVTLNYHLGCVSRPSCTASWSVSARCCPRLVPPYHPLLFFIFLSSWMHCLSISQAFSISLIAFLTSSAVWDPQNLWYVMPCCCLKNNCLSFCQYPRMFVALVPFPVLLKWTHCITLSDLFF